MRNRRTMRVVGLGGGFLIAALVGAVGAAPAAAQRVPATNTGVAACALADAMPACVDAVVGTALVGLPSPLGVDVRGGPLHENGGRDVEVAAHHSRMLAH
ncbi:MAG TPA: hypothetical protein VFQ80_05470 [Thermomicrobiales bacterium]|nr:hypothetical protein [Thermomicrobiales bacterium]